MSIITLVRPALIFRKNLIKVFIHLVIHTSVTDHRESRKNTNWTIVLNISLAFLLLAVFKFERKLELKKELLKLWHIK